jgi:hypothetical protein
MYIEDRLFSETSDEVLYSVTMTKEEYDLFSSAKFTKFKKAIENAPRVNVGVFNREDERLIRAIKEAKARPVKVGIFK